MHFISTSFSKDDGRETRFSSYYCISNHKNVIPKYLENALIEFVQTSRTLRQVLEEQAPGSDCGTKLPVPRNTATSEIDNDVMSLL